MHEDDDLFQLAYTLLILPPPFPQAMMSSVTIRDGQQQLMVAENLVVLDDVEILRNVEVELSNPQEPGRERIFISPVGAITMVSNSTTLQLKGPGPLADFMSTLRTLTYEYTSMRSLIEEQPNTLTRYSSSLHSKEYTVCAILLNLQVHHPAGN